MHHRFSCFPHHIVWFKVAEEFFSISNLECIPVQSSSDCHLLTWQSHSLLFWQLFYGL